MQQFQSLQRLLIFYVLSLLVMLVLYYATLFDGMKKHSEQHSIDTFYSLQHSIIEHTDPVNSEIKKILARPFLDDVSYQLILMTPSGQTYIHQNIRSDESAFAAVTFPTTKAIPANSKGQSAYVISSSDLKGTINLKSGHKICIILTHAPLVISWVSYRYWLPLMTAIILFIIALLYMLGRRANWEQLLVYTDSLSSHAKEAYTPPPFLRKKSTAEFMLLGHALSRVSYQLHNDYRRIKTLKHRLERLVDQAPLPMLMSVRRGRISFYNQRFEQIFAPSPTSEHSYELTDFVVGRDEPTQQLLQTLSSLQVARTLTVYGLENKQAYQLHITPWFGEHGQVHGFTVLFNDVNEIVNQNEQLQRQNKKLQHKLDELNKLRFVIGHKLRIPLEAMIDILEPLDPNKLDDRQSKILDTLIRTSQNMLTALNDTLHIGNIEVRKTRLNIEPIDIYKLGQDVNEMLIGDIRQKSLELIYFFEPNCPRYIDTDDVRLRQILLNLLHNAIKFTSLGHVALIVETVTQEQMPESSQNTLRFIDNNLIVGDSDCWVRFSIQDTGIGITTAKQHQLLASLNKSQHQENTLVEQNTIETELGLKNVNSFARLLGGFIELTSTVDEGSTFNLYLPCRRPNYQPVYHQSPHLSQIYLIAVVNQPLVAKHLQQLCIHLSITAAIYTSIDLAAIKQITEQLEHDAKTLAPLLLLDYEYYDTSTIVVGNDAKFNISSSDKKPSALTSFDATRAILAGSNQIVTSIDRRQALSSLLANTSLPKILFSTKHERRIPSLLLDQCDGFLTKPLDSALLLSELMRLTLPVTRMFTQTKNIEESVSELIISEATTQMVSPLILVVEDSLTNQKIACKMLSKLGYRSIVAEDGQQALDTLKEQREEISLILMDCRMPIMDGLQATQAIRAQDDDIPIVALTANNTEEDREACMQVGMDEFLSKPINKKELETVLQSLISLS
ncbi:response regulator [Psychrobacter sp. NG254]|uniref:response regulator n=1 Tax=Psychrobacter sp. NG254 TaxID=2782003 RepID=UPI001887F2ED|nr:response regulator [Psychrobacter sp. NG254]MBF2718836.1 response regulator [Psychrobacter sp. NG254]